MERREMIREAEKSAGGASFMNKKQMMQWLGLSRSTVDRRIREWGIIPQGRYYFIPEIVDGMMGRK